MSGRASRAWAAEDWAIVDTVTSGGLEEPWALARVIGMEGSGYRREGALLLVTRDRVIGAISGGCLEAEVAATAREVAASGRARVVRFDLTDPDEETWGWGTGCRGVVTVLVEPGPSAVTYLRLVASLSAAPARGQVATAIVDGAVTHRLVTPAATGDEVVQDVPSRPRLVVFGDGAGAVALRGLAGSLGWLVGDDAALTPTDLVVVMHHHVGKDVAAVTAALDARVRWLGVLGPEERRDRIRAAVVTDRPDLGEAVERVQGPVGLDLGAEGPAQIALAIVAQLLDHLHRAQ